MALKNFDGNRPLWNHVMISRQIPKRLRHLDTLSRNLWWCWNQEAIDLFKNIDPELWKKCDGNPIALLDSISFKRYKEMEKDDAFLAKLDKVYTIFTKYMSFKKRRKGRSISYFSMEYGLDASLKIYSGGLGILAGDYLKESSDMNIDMTAVGLLYRYGYFTQKLSSYGDQVAEYNPQDFMKIPASPLRDAQGNWLTITVNFPGRNLNARLWKVDVGRTELILLDTDFEDNIPEDRAVTHQLYGGDWENRFKQEILLGVGGIRALRLLEINTDVYHCNEGHAAFIGLERIHEFIRDNNLSFCEALEMVRSSSLFTTHTPVPAGHDSFSEDLLRKYISHYPERLKISWYDLMSLGRIDPDNNSENFSMSNLAAVLSQEINGVSWLHGKVTQDIMSNLWPGYLPEELHIGYVTNGVHHPTWTADEWKVVHSRMFGKDFDNHQYNKNVFEYIYNVADKEIWDIRSDLRRRMIDEIKIRLSNPDTTYYTPEQIVTIKKNLRDDILTVGFARRFATYKRAHLLFRSLDRLNAIINNPDRPIQFVFAGKAHPADKAGQDLIKRIVEVSKMPQFIGKIVFVPNYDMHLGALLTQGVDIWMNTPTRPLEASGTSGEKAVMNGVMHFSVLDGWWVEGYKEGAGWALSMERTYDNQDFQDELDAATIYNIFEKEIAPLFYSNKKLPVNWIRSIKNTVAQVASNFTTNRMFNDYIERYYNPLSKRYSTLIKDDFAVAKEIAAWKNMMREKWRDIEILSFTKPDIQREPLLQGKGYKSEIRMRIGDIDPDDLGVELMFVEKDAKEKYHIKSIYPYTFSGIEDGVVVYSSKIIPDSTGVYDMAGRLYAKNRLLPHRQDFELVKWI